MANFNKVLLMGNLTRDPQLSYLPSQTAVVDFGLAVNRRWTGKDGQTKEEVCFVDCRAFGKPAETINKYLSKGRPLFIEGRLTFDSWTAQDGTKRSKHRVTVENFQFLGGPPAGPAAGTGDTGDRQEAADGEQRPTEDVKAPEADDIPF
jgi:single-strand DNA-binding protein